MSNSDQSPQRQINSLDDLPAFASEAEEAEFWETHELGPALLAEMGPPDDVELPATRSRTTPISIRMDTGVLVEVKAEAAQRDTAYQTFMKEIVVVGLAVMRGDRSVGASNLSAPVHPPRLSVPDRPGARRQTEVVRQRGDVFDYAL
jgi:predicted DNA binding CopG/RHH family protein